MVFVLKMRASFFVFKVVRFASISKLSFFVRKFIMDADEQIRQAQESFKTITELKKKLEVLTEHVQSRKEVLEEEIEESLHEAIGNARDCLERVQENINPKLESIIRERLDILKVKMDRFTEEGLDTLHKEIDKPTPILTQKVLDEVDGLVESKLMMARNELSKSVEQKIQTAVKSVVSDHQKQMDERSAQLRAIGFVALGFALVALGLTISTVL